ncbi:hypothetical protein BGZ68_001675 [Mortierella alpina]|nr:hypothetical protein BGZ68_001675 [Mortierella alpina]
MKPTYNNARYVEGLKAELCRTPPTWFKSYECEIDLLEAPQVKIIPTRQLGDDIYCSTDKCNNGFHDTTTIATAHSTEVGFSVEASAAPFGMGVTMSASAGYGFSSSKEESTTVNYDFELKRGESGYIGLVNAQVSAKVRRRYCRCDISDIFCRMMGHGCTLFEETAHHESVIMKNGRPRGMVSFIYT